MTSTFVVCSRVAMIVMTHVRVLTRGNLEVARSRRVPNIFRSLSSSRRIHLSTEMRHVCVVHAETTETPVTLTTSQLEQLEKRFRRQDGKYDVEALDILEEEVGVPIKDWFPKTDLENIIQQGFVSFDQFYRLCEANLLLDGKLKEYKKAFDAIDRSGNGSIGYDELSDLLHFLGSPISDAKLTELMVEYDLDKSHQIEFNEFLLMFQNRFLDLKEVLRYTSEISTTVPERRGLIRLKEGEVVKIFSEEEFDEILDRNPDRLIVVFAGLTWCRPCRAMNKPYEKNAKEHKEAIFLKFFGNANSSTKHLFVDRLKAEATPAFFFLKNKELIHSHTGKNKEKFEEHLNEHL